MAASRGLVNKLDPAEILGTHLRIIDFTAQSAGRRARLSEDETLDLVAEVRARFVEGDYRIIKAWEGRSSIKTYFVSCALRFALDAIRGRGRYTTTAEALLRGPLAVRLEQLVQVEGFSPARAAAIVRERYAPEKTTEELVEMAESLAMSLPSAKDPLAQAGFETELVERLDWEAQGHKAQDHETILAEALSSMPAQDQLLIVWRYWEGLSASEIAKRLSFNQKQLYLRMEALHYKLRQILLASGIDIDAAMSLLAWSGWSIEELVEDRGLPKEVIHLAQELSIAIIQQFQSNPESLHELRPRQFEELVAELLASYGWRVELTPTTRDGGYDLFAISRDAAGVETSWIVECKRYRQDRPVGIEVVRALYGIKQDIGAANVLLATTSRFSRDVRAYKASRYDLELRDYEGIVDWINRYRPHPRGRLYIQDHRLMVPTRRRE